ncbi:MAG: hypothetical protein LC769_13020 [Chloroflexi bacterium]|nr:hypothetical protein [Chloroflexota bacterium]
MSKPRHRKLRALTTLTDRQLYALLVRVETLLLDRPPNGVDGADMAVELVRRDEARLVALCRAAIPAALRVPRAPGADALRLMPPLTPNRPGTRRAIYIA